jgi:hypothetical protein
MSFYHKYRADLLAVAAFFVLALTFFWQFLDGSFVLAFKDMSRYFYPLRYLMAEQVKAGHLPLWNPYIFCGFPLMASLQVGFFYPLTAIHYLLPFDLAFNYYTIIHYWLAACFMYALLRHYELRRSTAFFGGLVFAFSGYLLSVSNMNTSLSSVIWLPLALLFLDKFINSSLVPRRSSLVVLTLVLALMFLGGEPTILYVSGWFLAGYVALFSPNRWRDLLALALAYVGMAGLIAIQLLPFAELIRLSDRLTLIGYDFISSRSLPPRETINFILPYFFGNSGLRGGYTEVLLGKNNQDWLISIYFGAIPLIGLFFAWGRKRAGYFGGAALVALLLAYGRYTWFYRFLFDVFPGISLVRFPAKYLFLLTFCAAILAAFGLEEIVHRREKLARAVKAFGWCAAAALVLAAAGYLFVNQIFAYLMARYPANIPVVFFELLKNIIKFNLHSLYYLTGYLGGAAVILWLVSRQKIGQQMALALLILITAADLLANGSSIAVGVPAQIYHQEPASYRRLGPERAVDRFFYTRPVEEFNQIIYGKSYVAALLNTKDNFSANWHIPFHLYNFFGYESIRPFKVTWLVNTEFSGDKFERNLKELSAYNARFIIAEKPFPAPGLTLLHHKYAYGQDFYIYRNERAKPRAYLIKGRGAVTIDSYRPGRITLLATAETAATLFLSEASYPGWKFLVDGQFAGAPKPQAIFSAVELAPGRHRVEFVYDPLSLKVGALISGLTLLLGVGLLIRRR